MRRKQLRRSRKIFNIPVCLLPYEWLKNSRLPRECHGTLGKSCKLFSFSFNRPSTVDYNASIVTEKSKQVCVQLPTYTDNVALPAFASRPPLLQQSIEISCPPGSQQQTCSSGFVTVGPCCVWVHPLSFHICPALFPSLYLSSVASDHLHPDGQTDGPTP